VKPSILNGKCLVTVRRLCLATPIRRGLNRAPPIAAECDIRQQCSNGKARHDWLDPFILACPVWVSDTVRNRPVYVWRHPWTERGAVRVTAALDHGDGPVGLLSTVANGSVSDSSILDAIQRSLLITVSWKHTPICGFFKSRYVGWLPF